MEKEKGKYGHYLNIVVFLLSLAALISNISNETGGKLVVYLFVASGANVLGRYFHHGVFRFLTHSLNLLLLYMLYVDILQLKLFSIAILGFENLLLILFIVLAGFLFVKILKDHVMWSMFWLSLHILVFIETILTPDLRVFWSDPLVLLFVQKYTSIILFLLLTGLFIHTQIRFQNKSA